MIARAPYLTPTVIGMHEGAEMGGYIVNQVRTNKLGSAVVVERHCCFLSLFVSLPPLAFAPPRISSAALSCSGDRDVDGQNKGGRYWSAHVAKQAHSNEGRAGRANKVTSFTREKKMGCV